MELESLRTRLGIAQAWDKRADGVWLESEDLDVEEMARCMCEAEARLATITAIPLSQEECRLAYHWDLEGQLLTFVTITRQGHIPSIAAICPAAEWVEREVHDYFRVQLTGRDTPPPLVLRPGDPPGFFQWDGQGERQ